MINDEVAKVIQQLARVGLQIAGTGSMPSVHFQSIKLALLTWTSFHLKKCRRNIYLHNVNFMVTGHVRTVELRFSHSRKNVD